MSFIGKAIGLTTLVAFGFAGYLALGGKDGITDRVRKAERVVGRYSDRPVSAMAYDKYFRLSDGIIPDQDPSKLTLVLCYEGNSFDYKAKLKPSCDRRLVANGTGSEEAIAAKRKEIKAAVNKGVQAWVEIEVPTPQQRAQGLFDPYAQDFNRELQVFTPVELVKVRTFGQAKTDPSLFGTKPAKF